jgi:hypothetical protein
MARAFGQPTCTSWLCPAATARHLAGALCLAAPLRQAAQLLPLLLPLALQDFVVAVHARAAEAGGAAALSKRGQSMLELVVDIKNNR